MSINSVFFSKAFYDQFAKSNYKVFDYNENNEFCYIYFSGNGIFDPNTLDVFEKRIVNEDRYEWCKWSSTKPSRVIFVRDIHKMWYQKGINSQACDIDSLLRLLKKLTNGYRIITVGNSAGGYAATLFGVLLGAERIFGFSSQYDIHSRIRRHILFNCNYNKDYLNIVDLTRSSNIPVYYFYPSLSEDDANQMALVKDIPNVHCVGIRSKLHGKAVYSNNLPTLLDLDDTQLDILCSKFEGRDTFPFVFSIAIVGVKDSLVGFSFNTLKPLYYKFNDWRRKNKIE